MKLVLPNAGYSYVASTKKLTLEVPYDALSLGQILSIRNMTTRSLYYEPGNPQQSITMDGDEITHDYDDGDRDSDSDIFQIIIEDLSIIRAGQLRVIDHRDSVSQGLTEDTVVQLATGSKTGIATGAYKLVEADDFVQPPNETDLQFYVHSTSANDTSDGSGVQQFTIVYLSAGGGAKKTQVVTMNGTSVVAIPNVDKYRIHSVDVTRGHPAAGTITITNFDDNILYGSIEQYKTYMERCIFYVAEDEQVIGIEAICSSTSAGGVYISIFASEEDATGNVVTRARRPFRINDTTISMVFAISEVVSNPNNKLIAFGAAVTAATGAPVQDAEVTLIGYTRPIP